MPTGLPQPTGAVAPPPSPSGDVTNPISDESPVEPSTGQPLPNPGGGDYTGMMQQAKNAWNSSNFQMVQHILTRAIQTQPDNPRAYSGLGELYLYAYNNSGLAMQNFQAAIARGGEAVFHVMHDHSAGTFVTHCRGYLRISANGVRYQPVPASVHAFAVSRKQIREARNNHDISFSFRRGSRPGIDFHSFHIRLMNGENFNFAPESRSGEAERQMILGFIGR